jgi:hypothetical protein
MPSDLYTRSIKSQITGMTPGSQYGIYFSLKCLFLFSSLSKIDVKIAGTTVFTFSDGTISGEWNNYGWSRRAELYVPAAASECISFELTVHKNDWVDTFTFDIDDVAIIVQEFQPGSNGVLSDGSFESGEFGGWEEGDISRVKINAKFVNDSAGAYSGDWYFQFCGSTDKEPISDIISIARSVSKHIVDGYLGRIGTVTDINPYGPAVIQYGTGESESMSIHQYSNQMSIDSIVLPLQDGGKVAIPVKQHPAIGDRVVVLPLQDGGKIAVALVSPVLGDTVSVVFLQGGGKVAIPVDNCYESGYAYPINFSFPLGLDENSSIPNDLYYIGTDRYGCHLHTQNYVVPLYKKDKIKSVFLSNHIYDSNNNIISAPFSMDSNAVKITKNSRLTPITIDDAIYVYSLDQTFGYQFHMGITCTSSTSNIFTGCPDISEMVIYNNKDNLTFYIDITSIWVQYLGGFCRYIVFLFDDIPSSPTWGDTIKTQNCNIEIPSYRSYSCNHKVLGWAGLKY